MANGMETLIAPTINLAVLLGLLAYYLRRPLKDFARNRSVLIREELRSVRTQLEEAQREHAEFTGKLKAMDAEVADLKAQAARDAEAMRSRIMTDAQKTAANAITDARTASIGLFSEFKDQLYAELAGSVLDRAEELLRERLTGADRDRIREEFAHALVRSSQ